jgi:hypothetical protein
MLLEVIFYIAVAWIDGAPNPLGFEDATTCKLMVDQAREHGITVLEPSCLRLTFGEQEKT